MHEKIYARFQFLFSFVNKLITTLYSCTKEEREEGREVQVSFNHIF